MIHFSTLDSSHRCHHPERHPVTSLCITIIAMSSFNASFFVQGNVFVVIYTAILSDDGVWDPKQRDEGRSRWMLEVRPEHWARPPFFFIGTERVNCPVEHALCRLWSCPRSTHSMWTSVEVPLADSGSQCRALPGRGMSHAGVLWHLLLTCWERDSH